MARRPKSPDAKVAPTRDDILTFLSEQKGKAGKREIARAFGINAASRVHLKRTLKELENDGLIEKRRRALHRAGDLPPVLVAEVVRIDAHGDLVAIPRDFAVPEGEEPPKLLIRTQHAGRRAGKPGRLEGGDMPGLGDVCLVRVDPLPDEEGFHPARVMKRLSHKRERVLGVFRALPDGSGRIVPVDKRAQGKEYRIAAADSLAAQDGDLVSVEADGGRHGGRGARVREKLGSIASEKAISLIAIQSHDIPHVFSERALAEAAAAPEASMKGREDWRKVPLVTIDPADAKDHDDAVHAEPDTDPENPGGFVLHVAIADVAAYIRPGSALDREALDRGNSVYFPDRVVPMLPERISNDLCSLKPEVDRPALALRMVIDAKGRKKSQTLHRVMIRSAAKLAYPQAQAAIDGKPDEVTGPLLEPILRPLWAAYALLKKARDDREPLDLDLPERKLILDAKGHVLDVIVPERLDAHKLIEEFMILANVAAAELLEPAKLAFLYRVHDAPSLQKMEGLRAFLETLGVGIGRGVVARPALFNRILSRLKDSENAQLVNEVVLRSQSQAEYSPQNIGHFGLNLRKYAHFTSPIRRYADLIVHRGLIRAARLGEDGLPDIGFDQMRDIGALVSAAERRAMAAERETVDRLIAHYLADRIGAVFAGRVSGVTKAGLFIRLDETGADGFIPISTLGEEFFRFDEAAKAISGSRTGETFRLGDSVRVRLVEAAPIAGALRFEMMSKGRYVSVSKTRGRLRPAREERETRDARPGRRRRGTMSDDDA